MMFNKYTNKTTIALMIFGLSLIPVTRVQAGCGLCGSDRSHDQTHQAHTHPAGIHHAVAVIEPTEGNQASGVFYFTQTDAGVEVQVALTGLTPNQKHGVHVHEFGDRTVGNGTSAGGHYNPDGHPHGLPPKKNRHAGSFGNLKADARGRVQAKFVDTTISVQSGKNPIIGRSVVVHADSDDGSQPSGNAGPRIGVGVIGIQNTSK